MFFFYYVFSIAFVYFFVIKRRFDFFSLAFISCSVYFFPGFFGVVGVYRFGPESMNEISGGAYGSMILILTLLVFSALIWDRFMSEHISSSFKHVSIVEVNVVFVLGMIIGLTFIGMEWDEIFSPGKPSYGRISSLFTPVITLGAVLSLASQRYYLLFAFIFFILIDVYAGNREAATFFALGSVLVRSVGKQKSRFLERYFLSALLLLLAGFLLILYKGIGYALSAGRIDLVLDRLQSIDYYYNSILGSEPFVTQDILNSAIVHSNTYFEDWFWGLLKIFTPMGDVVYLEIPTSISKHLAELSYSHLDFGVAGNIWADGHAAGGWLLFTSFALIYSFIPIIFNIAVLRSKSLLGSSSVVLLGVVLLFFSHRSGLFYTATIASRFFFIFVVIWVLVYFINIVCATKARR